jgi:ABC-type multidrug transport system fused ATPase/permease subunit
MKWQPKHTSLAVIATGFALFYLLFHKNWMLVPVGIVCIGFIIAPLGKYIHLAWMMLAKVLGWINSRILLTILFFVILTPVALLARLFGKTSIKLTAANSKSSFMIRNHIYTKEDLINPW